MPKLVYTKVTNLLSSRFTQIDDLCQFIIQQFPETKDSFYICGGATLAEYTHDIYDDIDIFVTKLEVAKQIEKLLVSNLRQDLRYYVRGRYTYDNLYNAKLINHRIDSACSLVNIVWSKTNTTVEEILTAFDFTICSVGYDPTNRIFYEPPDFQQLIKDRILSLNDWNRKVPPAAQIKRILKYMQKDFLPDALVHHALMTALRKLLPVKIGDILELGGLQDSYETLRRNNNNDLLPL